MRARIKQSPGTRSENSDLGFEDSATAELLDYMESRGSVPNTLGEEVATLRWSQRSSTLRSIPVSDLTEFPMMTNESLLKSTSGPFQIENSRTYLAEIVGPDGEVPKKCVILEPTIIRVVIRSRHSESVKYRVYIDYEPRKNGVKGIKRYYCECKNGARTRGCCSHVATIVYYLSYARWLPEIPRPADFLTDLFVPEGTDSEADPEDGTAGPSHAE